MSAPNRSEFTNAGSEEMCSQDQSSANGMKTFTNTIDGNNHSDSRREVNSSCRQKTLPVGGSKEHGNPEMDKRLESCNGCERQRHKGRSEKVSNGHHELPSLWPSQSVEGPSCPPLLSNMAVSPGDDMENYFNANAHMLDQPGTNDASAIGASYQDWPNGDLASQGLDVYETWITNEGSAKSQTADEGVEMSEDRQFSVADERTAAYLCEEYLGVSSSINRCDSNDSLYNHCTDDIYQSNLANSVEDLGDFIETDIPKNPYDCGSSDSTSSRSRTPSEDDLPTLALDPSSRVTGAGDIQGALSLDWNMQYNIENAQRPPSLLVANKPSALSSETNGCRPRVASDTDYGFYTPTSGVSGSSLRTQSIQSPQLSEYSAPCGLNSADSSAFASPDNENEQVTPMSESLHCVRPRDGPTVTLSHVHDADPLRLSSAHSNQESHTTLSLDRYWCQRAKQDNQPSLTLRSADLENLNLDRTSWKSSKEKSMDLNVQNRDSLQPNVEKRRRNKGSGTSGEGSSLTTLEGQSLLPSTTPAKSSLGANRLDCVHYGHNDLNPRSHGASDSSGRISQSSDQFNVSRQTSTSDFDQDENSYQEIIDFPPGLLEPSCPSCDEDDDDDTAFHSNPENPRPQEPLIDPHTCAECAQKLREKHAVSLAERRRVQQNLLQIATGQAEEGSIDNLLQSIPVEQIPPADIDPQGSSIEDIPLPPQTPILNRQWLKKAAKYLDYNFLYKSLFKDESDSDSDSDGPLEDGLRDSDFDFEVEAHGSESCRDPAHIKGRKMLYSVLLKDALLKHLQDKSALYNNKEGGSSDIKKVMLWTEYQAYILQVSQIGTSACGATAVINVLKYFDMYIEQDLVCEVIKTNMRAETATVGEYLLSRSIAGTTATQLIEGVHKLTDGGIFGRFFHLFPERDININKWLGEWMKKGAVPVVTLNRQRAIPKGWVVPDAWHHQMVYGVGPKGVYLTNPLEIVPEYVIQYQLSSESVLLVRRNDVVSRWHGDCNLGILLQQDDVRWQDMNVLGQVVNVLREDRAPHTGNQCPQLTSHITVPAWYKSGVTLFIRRDSETFTELSSLPEELPLKSASNASTETQSSVESSLQHLFAEGGEGSGGGEADTPPQRESPS